MSTALTKQNGNTSVAHTDDAPRAWASAPVDVLEGVDAYLVFADLPGVTKEDIDIEYAAGELRLRARRPAGEWDGWPGEYRRTFSVGHMIDVDGISAELEHGVLRVHMPKAEAAKPRQIAIQAG